jgi:hypothetical protein
VGDARRKLVGNLELSDRGCHAVKSHFRCLHAPSSTTNTPFSDSGNILFNTTIATVITDCLVENSEILLLGGDSLRKPSKSPDSPAELSQPVHAPTQCAPKKFGGVRVQFSLFEEDDAVRNKQRRQS